MLTATLDKLTEYAHRYPEVHKDEVRKGDWVIIRTVRSVYTLHSLGDDLYEVRGGWFDKNGCGPVKTGVAGATWGGSVIMPQVLAACGMCVEFRNSLITSPVKKIVIVPKWLGN
jgi:hypothetical protein